MCLVEVGEVGCVCVDGLTLNPSEKKEKRKNCWPTDGSDSHTQFSHTLCGASRKPAR